MSIDLAGLSGLQLALLLSLGAGLATGVGALPVYFLPRAPRPATESLLLGSAAGVMLAASFTSLLAPALALAEAAAYGALAVAAQLAGGALIGGLGMELLHRHLPHEHFAKGLEGRGRRSIERRWLFVFAIALHNLPEGLAVGIGAATGELGVSLPLAIGIGLQNLPEGLIVAASLRSIGYARTTAFGIALISGLIEPVGGLLGFLAVSVADALLPIGLSVAAGAMLWVVGGEVIPESHREGRERHATFGLLGGAVLMVLLDGLVR